MFRIFNFNRFPKGGNESTLSENFGSMSLSSGEVPKERSFAEKTKKIGKRVSRFLGSYIGNSSSTADIEILGYSKERQVTSGALNIWLELPDEIKYDPALASFKQLYERQRGRRPVEVRSSRLPNDIIMVQPRDEGVREYEPATARGLYEQREIQEHAADAFDREQQHHSVFHEEALVKRRGNFASDQPAADEEEKQPRTKLMKVLFYVKMTVLVLTWISCTTALMIWNEKEEVVLQTYVVPMETKNYMIKETQADLRIQLKVSGPFAPAEAHPANASAQPNITHLAVWLERWSAPVDQVDLKMSTENVIQSSEVITLELLPDERITSAKASTRTRVLNLAAMVNASAYQDELASTNSSQEYVMRMRSNSSRILPLVVSYSKVLFKFRDGVIYALVILFALNILTVFEIVNLTFSTVLTSTMCLAALTAVGERPSMEEMISWIDMETLLLLFAMMLLVAILAETGIFDYLAVMAFKFANGQAWTLIFSLCLTTALISSFLDNVTTVLLTTPVTIRLCEVMELNPAPVLMATVIYSNVGGTATPVGDPPNVIIVTSRAVMDAGINFTEYTIHMLGGILLVGLQTFLQLRWTYRDVNKLRNSLPPDIQRMKQEIAVWRRAAASLAQYSVDEALVRAVIERHAARLQRRLRRKLLTPPPPLPRESFAQTVREMEQKYPIRDKVLLIEATTALSFVVILFFFHSVPELKRLSLGWTALMGAILLLILADRADLEPFISQIQWSTLLSFAALFIIMEALAKLGLIDFIGDVTEYIILQVPVKYRLMTTILLLLWVSALVSAFVDNVPLTTMMVQVVSSLDSNPALALPFTPLVWSIAFGSCLGGNGTLIGASANMVCVTVAEQHGYRITFAEFFKFSFPIMIGHIVVISIYLLLSHCVFEWH